jgi:hypothetical protein
VNELKTAKIAEPSIELFETYTFEELSQHGHFISCGCYQVPE